MIGAGAQIGDGARLRESVLLPGAEVPADGLLAGAIAGNARALAGTTAASPAPDLDCGEPAALGSAHPRAPTAPRLLRSVVQALA